MESSRPIKVRFAPSPTGPFSIGNARTALFNWLFVKSKGGEFLLRIEDTDKERSKKAYEKEILEGLKWLGLAWNEKPVRQSERLELYESALQKLLDEKRAYWCFCLPEDLEAERQAQLSQGMAPKYGGRCRNLSEDEAEKRRRNGKPAVIRFKMPEKKVTVNDLVRGQVHFDAELLGDIIIAKDLKEPLYNFAAAVDDAEMEITHVIRGEDHLANTPKQILIQEALGLSHPHFAHLPLILGPNRKKLSKRHLDKSFLDYRKEGYLPAAMLNFLVLLGWHPVEDRETISQKEQIQEFTLERVQKGGAIFNEEKLNWLNAHYLKQLEPEEILENLKPFIPAAWLKKKKMLLTVIKVEKERMRTFHGFKELAAFFFELPDYNGGMLIWKQTPQEKILDNLKKTRDVIKNPGGVSSEKIMILAEREGKGEVLWPLRVALSGRDASPGPLEILEVLGKTEALKRINRAIKKLES
jgi:glutamyl-tRNA synthetase